MTGPAERPPSTPVAYESMPVEEFCRTFKVGSYDHSWQDEADSLLEMHRARIVALAASVLERGFDHPVTVIDGVVMNGHHRVVVAMILGGDVPFVRDWQEIDYDLASPQMTPSAPTQEDQ